VVGGCFGIRGIDSIDDIAMTSNGFFLKDKLADLKSAGLSRVSISLDSVNAAVFADISGRDEKDLSNVLDGITEAIVLGMSPVKINMVVMKDVNASHILDMIDFFKDTPCSLRFIEYMDTGTVNNWSEDEVMSAAEIITEIESRYVISPVEDPKYGEVASRYEMQDFPLRLGFITSVSRPFCRDCVRARISADGKFFSCLFGASSFDFLELMRSGAGDEEIADVLRGKWAARDDRYSELRSELKGSAPKEEMFKLGG
jgi:GTP 3',8-cyclase